MMRKWFVFLALLSVLFVSACNNSEDNLSGKTFKVTYPPVLEEDINNPSKYSSITTLQFSDGKVVSNKIHDTEGTYELNDDVLVVNFENENEKLEINFIDFKESDLEFSAYSTAISEPKWDIKDSNQISHFENLFLDLDVDLPIEFIEK